MIVNTLFVLRYAIESSQDFLHILGKASELALLSTSGAPTNSELIRASLM